MRRSFNFAALPWCGEHCHWQHNLISNRYHRGANPCPHFFVRHMGNLWARHVKKEKRARSWVAWMPSQNQLCVISFFGVPPTPTSQVGWGGLWHANFDRISRPVSRARFISSSWISEFCFFARTCQVEAPKSLTRYLGLNEIIDLLYTGRLFACSERASVMNHVDFICLILKWCSLNKISDDNFALHYRLANYGHVKLHYAFWGSYCRH